MLGTSPIGVAPIGAMMAAAVVNASAPGAVLVATSSMTGGSASGAAAGVAGGAQLVAASSMVGGSATGAKAATAPGAVLTALSAMVGGAASGGSDGSIPRPVTVPPSRTAQFAARSRVIVFNTVAPVSVPKVAGDELYFVGDFSFDLKGSATTAQTVEPIPVGVTLLEGPSIQGNLIVVKLGGFDTAPGAKNYFTYRVTGANGEQFDRTIEFTQADDRSWTFGKDPDDKLLYAFDVSADATFGASALASIQSPVVAGVTALSAPVVQGNLAVIKIGGLSLVNGAANSYGLTFLFANGEKIVRSIYFKKEDH